MSLDLRDLRVKLPVEVWAAIRARAEINGKEMSEVAREVLQAWFVQQRDEIILLNQILEREGLTGLLKDSDRK